MSNQTPSDLESPVEKQARLRVELIEREVREKWEAFRAEMRGHVDGAGAMVAHAHALDTLFQAIKSGLPALATSVRRKPSERTALVAARDWWRQLRQDMTDRALSEASGLPETVAWKGAPWRDGSGVSDDAAEPAEPAEVTELAESKPAPRVRRRSGRSYAATRRPRRR